MIVPVPPKTRRRFWSRIRVVGACWLWTGALDSSGYGAMRADGRSLGAHRVAYMLCVGEIPDGLVIDHLCRTPRCVNPGHPEPVTNLENSLRGISGTRQRAKTHCPAGHAYAGDNLRVLKSRERACAICRRAAAKRCRDRKRAVAR